MATAREMGARLQAMADEVVRGVNGPKSTVVSALAEAVAALAECKLAAEEPTSEVAGMLGEDHPGTYTIVESTAHVTAALEAVAEMVQGAIHRTEQIADAASNLGFAYTNVGADIARAGGGA
jgi:uncharacterized protein (DUF2342 family)